MKWSSSRREGDGIKRESVSEGKGWCAERGREEGRRERVRWNNNTKGRKGGRGRESE